MMRQQLGFTLIELIVAVAVFAVVALMAYGGLDLILRSRAGLEQSFERQREIERAVLRIERDLRQSYARAVRGAYGEEQPAMAGDSQRLSFSSLELRSDADGVAARGARIGYLRRDGALWRSADPVLDRSPRETARLTQQLQRVARVQFSYLGEGNQRLDQWPPRTGIVAPERLPRAVEVLIELEDVGEIVRLIELPEAPR